MNQQYPDNDLDLRLTRALAAMPTVRVPDDFTRRVMQRLPVRLPAIAYPHVGRRVSFAAAAALLVAMLLVARLAQTPGHPGYTVYTVVEWSFAAEFILLTLWLNLRPHLSR